MWQRESQGPQAGPLSKPSMDMQRRPKNPLQALGMSIECSIRTTVQELTAPSPIQTGRRFEAFWRRYVAVRIRLKRFGRRHRSCYRVSAVDSRIPRDGRVIEELGWYDPGAGDPDKQVSLKRERIEYWLGKGARPSDTVARLLKRQGIG